MNPSFDLNDYTFSDDEGTIYDASICETEPSVCDTNSHHENLFASSEYSSKDGDSILHTGTACTSNHTGSHSLVNPL